MNLDSIRVHMDIVHTHLRELLREVVSQAQATTIDNTIELPDDIPEVTDAIDLLMTARLLRQSPYGVNWYEIAHDALDEVQHACDDTAGPA